MEFKKVEVVNIGNLILDQNSRPNYYLLNFQWCVDINLNSIQFKEISLELDATDAYI